MQHEAHVGLVDAHAERGRRHHDPDGSVEEAVVDRVPAGPGHAGVVRGRGGAGGGDRLGEVLGPPARGRRRRCRCDRARPARRPARRGRGPWRRRRRTVRPTRRSRAARSPRPRRRDSRMCEPVDDVGAHGRRGRGGEGDHDGMAEGVDDVAEAAVVGAEVVAPLADAVRLVDDEQRRPGGHQRVERVLAGELLGSEEHELEVAVAQRGERLGAGTRRPPRRRSARPRPRPRPRARRPGRAGGRSSGDTTTVGPGRAAATTL